MDKQMISSAGMLFLYLAGEVSEDGAIGIHWTDSYQRPLDFYERVRELRAEISDKVDLEIFCVLGVSFMKNTDKASRLSSYMAILLLQKCLNFLCRCMQKILDVF